MNYIWPEVPTERLITVYNRKSEHRHWILHIRISLGTNFLLILTILIFLEQIYRKWVFLVYNRKSKFTHWILHIRIGLGNTFQLNKLTILIFWTKFAQKGYFQSKTEKVNFTIEFCEFELA